MKILVLLGHPQPGSFNHALAGAVVETLQAGGHEVNFHDLQAEGFDPVMTAAEIASDGPVEPEIARHCDELASAEGIVVVHPNWWGQPPAILKGWIDRVVLPGVAYRFLEGDDGEGVPEGLLKVKTAVVLNTSNTELERELAAFGDPLEALWVRCVFGLCGVEDVRRRTFSVVVTSSAKERAAWLDEAAELVRDAFPL
ncbi:MAG: NAD(P)H-dependent oxidoreductase [Gaiellaceae bacterium]